MSAATGCGMRAGDVVRGIMVEHAGVPVHGPPSHGDGACVAIDAAHASLHDLRDARRPAADFFNRGESLCRKILVALSRPYIARRAYIRRRKAGGRGTAAAEN